MNFVRESWPSWMSMELNFDVGAPEAATNYDNLICENLLRIRLMPIFRSLSTFIFLGFTRFYLDEFWVLQNIVFLMLFGVFESREVTSQNTENRNAFLAILGPVLHNCHQNHKNTTGFIRFYLKHDCRENDSINCMEPNEFHRFVNDTLASTPRFQKNDSINCMEPNRNYDFIVFTCASTP